MANRRPIPIACTLNPGEAGHQLSEWRELQLQATAISPIDGGIRMTLPATLGAQATDLAQREANCCAFLTLVVREAEGEVVLDITSYDDAARPVIAMLAGNEP